MNRIKLIYLQQNRTETGNARRDRWPCPLPLGRSPADEFGCEKSPCPVVKQDKVTYFRIKKGLSAFFTFIDNL